MAHNDLAMRREISRINGALGGEVRRRQQAEKYLANPSRCRHCQTVLPQKKKRNRFCSQSCAAIYNNTGRIRALRYACGHCGTDIFQGKYCSIDCTAQARRKYSPEQAREIWRSRVREVSAAYRARLRDQTPADADRKAIREFYEACPEGYEVDHIVPISRGGLHTLSNLQYLTRTENRRKGNRI